MRICKNSHTKNFHNRIIFISIFIVILPFDIHCQEIRLSGRISSMETGEVIQDAVIYSIEKKNAVRCNTYGFYSLNLPKGMNTLVVQAPGYKIDTISIHIPKDLILDIPLAVWTEVLDNFTITEKESLINHAMGSFRISGKQVNKIPMVLSEPDILKALQMLPGVQGGADGTSGVHIRGGSPDQTLILIDGVTIYNINHLFGFFSIFNPDIIATADLYKSELPARFSGRLSSALDITMREGNTKKLSGGIQISPISTKIRLEGPLKKDTSSFIISYRRTWLDLLASLAQQMGNSGTKSYLGFSDATAKMNYKLNRNSQLFLSLYWGKDAFGANSKSARDFNSYKLSWGNLTTAVRYQFIFPNSIFSQTSLSYTNYQSHFKNTSQVLDSRYSTLLKSTISDFNLKSDWSYHLHSDLKLSWGAVFTKHYFNPDLIRNSGDISGYKNLSSDSTRTLVSDNQLHAEIEYTRGPLSLRAGVNFTEFSVNKKHYSIIQPRVSTKLAITPEFGLKAAYFRSGQYLHLLTNSSVGLPSDLWVPVTEKIAPQESHQLSLGTYSELNKITFSIEAYYKKMKNIIEFLGAGRGIDKPYGNWQEWITVGTGDSKGIELFIEKKDEYLDAFLSYSLSKTTRLFEQLNEGEPFPYKYDRRHVLNFFSEYRFKKGRSLSLAFQYSTGSYITLASSQYSSRPTVLETSLTNSYAFNYFKNFDQIEYLPKRNNYLMPANHHLDINYRVQKTTKKGIRIWTFSIYNIYNRKNPFFIFIHDSKLKQFSLLPVLPSISYEYRF